MWVLLQYGILIKCASFLFSAFGPAAIFLVLCGFFGGHSKWAAFVLITLAIGVNGIEVASYIINHIDIAPRFAGLLMGISSTFSTVAGILAPQVAKAIAHSDVSWDVVCLFIVYL